MKKIIFLIIALLSISIYFYIKNKNENDDRNSKKEYQINKEKGKVLAEEFYQKGLKKLEYKDFHGAINDFYQATRNDNEMTKAYSMKGDCEYQIRRYMDAVSSYTQAIHLNKEGDKKISSYYYNRGNATIALDRYDSACNDFSKAVEYNRNNIWALTAINEYCN